MGSRISARRQGRAAAAETGRVRMTGNPFREFQTGRCTLVEHMPREAGSIFCGWTAFTAAPKWQRPSTLSAESSWHTDRLVVMRYHCSHWCTTAFGSRPVLVYRQFRSKKKPRLAGWVLISSSHCWQNRQLQGAVSATAWVVASREGTGPMTDERAGQKWIPRRAQRTETVDRRRPYDPINLSASGGGWCQLLCPLVTQSTAKK